MENSDSQPKMRGTKKKSLPKPIFFFTVEKKSGGNLVEEVQSPKTIPNLPKSINSKHRKSEEDFDYENAAAIWGLRKKKKQENNSYLL